MHTERGEREGKGGERNELVPVDGSIQIRNDSSCKSEHPQCDKRQAGRETRPRRAKDRRGRLRCCHQAKRRKSHLSGVGCILWPAVTWSEDLVRDRLIHAGKKQGRARG
jgi:hypothetical protein